MKKLFVCLLTFLLASLTISWAETPSPSWMLNGFENIKLGMSWADVITSRPNAKLFAAEMDGKSPKPTGNHPEGLLIEPPPSDNSAPGVSYVFDEGKLVSISFVVRPTKENRERILRHVVDKAGNQASVFSSNKEVKQANVVYQDDNVVSIAIVPAEDDSLTSKSRISLMVTDRKFAQKGNIVSNVIGDPKDGDDSHIQNERVEHLKSELQQFAAAREAKLAKAAKQ